MKTSYPLVVFVSVTVALGAGCTFPSRGSVYDRSSAGRSMSVDVGDVVAVEEAQVSGRSTIIGMGGGGLVGGASASGIGRGTGSAVASAVGAVGGAIVGEAVEEVATRKNAQTITIKLANGETIAVIQPVERFGRFEVGQRVQVLQGGGANTSVRRL